MPPRIESFDDHSSGGVVVHGEATGKNRLPPPGPQRIPMSKQPLDSTYGQTRGLLSAVMASCRDAIIAWSFEGQIEAWNLGAEEIFGYTRDEAVGADVSLTTPPDRYDELNRLRTAARDGQAIEHFDTVRTRKSGESFPAAICGFPIRDAKNSVVGYATIERDISDRVRAANALRAALAEAQDASTAKSRFLANASHELRTPMNAIVGMTALALEENLSHELRDYLETIRDSSDSMLHLINDVLDLSRFESERFQLDEISFEPRELVESTVKVLGSAAHAKGLELVCHVAPETPVAVVGDPVRLRQVLTNLVGNAVKFTDSGEVVVDLLPVRVEGRRCLIRFSVRDTGIGISGEDQKRIFAPFSQVDGAVTRRYTGSGLGLTISQHLISCFGGKLQVESTPGRGSCFSFELIMPIASGLDSADADARSAERLRGMSVLVVDDNEASRSALTEQFQAWHMQAEATSSGNEAIELLSGGARARRHYDLAVIDALMPGTDGFKVASLIKKNTTIATRPILMASVTDRLEFSRRCAEAGAAAFVQKPVQQSQLLNAVVQASGVASLDPPPSPGLFDKPDVQPLRILLVEDTPANRKVVQQVLTRRGHSLHVAVNGREAIDAFRKEEFDVVLMDVQMPIMDGYQATEAIREMEREANNGRATPVIAMTAHSMRGDRERCLRAGMDGYLSKPLDLQEVIRVVESISESMGGEPSAGPSAVTVDLEIEPSKTGEDSLDDTCCSSPDETTDDNAVVVDLDGALSRLRNDRGLLLDMVGFYEEDAPRLLDTIRETISSGELQETQRAAHSLKGLAATFNADIAMAAALKLEHAARDKQGEQIPALFNRLERETHRVLHFFKAYRENQTV